MKKQSRRKFLLGSLGVIGAGLASGWIFRRNIIKKFFFKSPYNPDITISNADSGNDLCVVTTQQTEGPFYFPSPQRTNITEDRQGKSMKLKLQVLNHPDCTPVEGALVDIWHCDADGNYSGYPEEISRDVWKSFVLLTKHAKELPSGQIHVEPLTDTRYLRGMQRTNAEGWVEFQTIFPGWYEGRVPHVHVKVILNPDEEVITQLYFDREMQDRIYTTLAPYDKHGKSPLTIYDDSVVAGTGKNQLDGLMLKPQWSGDAPLQAVGKIGISTA